MDKCSTSDSGKVVTPCESLKKACEHGNPRGKAKGIFAWALYNINQPCSDGPSRVFFGVKSGNFVAKGFAFNFCPFCGERIDKPFAEEATT